jgi:alpha-beta hydrolase superfamily lysophospholipase
LSATSPATNPAALDEPPWAAEAAAHRRAMPPQRLLSGGMEWADATGLYAAVDAGVPWHEAARDLGDANRERAEAALSAGRLNTAKSWFLCASSCYRFGQVPLIDWQADKRTMYRLLIESFGRAAALHHPPIQHIEIRWHGRRLYGWLIRPPENSLPPVVIQIGGFDGWREEYYNNACYLRDRGIASLLIDGPGQGETRLFGRVHLDSRVADAFRAVVDFVVTDSRVSDCIGIWGNSMGGFLAALAATRDPRIAACCVNGGTVRPAEILDRYPRFISKVQALLGMADPAAARDTINRLILAPQDLQALRCSLHVVHGTPDRVFLIDNARKIYDHAGSQDRTFSEFPDGDHCIYNHAHERNCLIADWFAERLASRG